MKFDLPPAMPPEPRAPRPSTPNLPPKTPGSKKLTQRELTPPPLPPTVSRQKPPLHQKQTTNSENPSGTGRLLFWIGCGFAILLVIVFLSMASQSSPSGYPYSPPPRDPPSDSSMVHSQEPTTDKAPPPALAVGLTEGEKPLLKPTPSPKPTSTPETSYANLPSSNYRVIGISENDVLNVRSAPGVRQEKIAEWKNGTSGISVLGDPAYADGATWYRVTHNGVAGWVNGLYISNSASVPPTRSRSRKTIEIPRGFHMQIHGRPGINTPSVVNVPPGIYSVDIDPADEYRSPDGINWLRVTIIGYEGWVTERLVKRLEH